MNTPTDQQIKIDYLVDRISRVRYLVYTLLGVCAILCVGMVYVASDNRTLRLEVKQSLKMLEGHHAQIHANHDAMRQQYEVIARKLRKLTSGE